MKIKVGENNIVNKNLLDGFWLQGCKIVKGDETPDFYYLTSTDDLSNYLEVVNNTSSTFVYHISATPLNDLEKEFVKHKSVIVIVSSKQIKDLVSQLLLSSSIKKDIFLIEDIIGEFFYLDPIKLVDSYHKSAAEVVKIVSKSR